MALADLSVPARRARGMNAIGKALLLGKQQIGRNDITGERRMIDT
jgi:hypothetical protein